MSIDVQGAIERARAAKARAVEARLQAQHIRGHSEITRRQTLELLKRRAELADGRRSGSSDPKHRSA